jgi:hypothetical protein
MVLQLLVLVLVLVLVQAAAPPPAPLRGEEVVFLADNFTSKQALFRHRGHSLTHSLVHSLVHSPLSCRCRGRDGGAAKRVVVHL